MLFLRLVTKREHTPGYCDAYSVGTPNFLWKHGQRNRKTTLSPLVGRVFLVNKRTISFWGGLVILMLHIGRARHLGPGIRYFPLDQLFEIGRCRGGEVGVRGGGGGEGEGCWEEEGERGGVCVRVCGGEGGREGGSAGYIRCLAGSRGSSVQRRSLTNPGGAKLAVTTCSRPIWDIWAGAMGVAAAGRFQVLLGFFLQNRLLLRGGQLITRSPKLVLLLAMSKW